MNNIIEQIPLSKLEELEKKLLGMLEAGNDLLALLENAKSKPHVLDDATITHMKRVYTDQREEIKNYQKILKQWLKDQPSKQQQMQLKTFESAIQAVIDMHAHVFFLIDFFKEHTIEQILRKDDAELALDLLTGKIFPP